MTTLFRGIFHLLALVGIGVVLGACSVPPASLSATPKPLILPCTDSAFALPEEVLQTGEWLGSWEAGERMRKLKWQQYGWLSVHLDLLQSEVWYGDPIPIRLTVTNETAEKPVIFLRPQWATFLPDDYPFPPSHPKRPTPRPHLDDWEAGNWPFPVQIYVSMTPFPASLKLLGGQYQYFYLYYYSYLGLMPKYPQEAFSMLPPGQSCTIEREVTWDGDLSPLAKPIPPGKYTLRVFLAGTALGPVRVVTIDNDKYLEMLDIGGWVGCSAASNAVTLTVWPLREDIPP